MRGKLVTHQTFMQPYNYTAYYVYTQSQKSTYNLAVTEISYRDDNFY